VSAQKTVQDINNVSFYNVYTQKCLFHTQTAINVHSYNTDTAYCHYYIIIVTLLCVLYFTTYDCVYTDLVMSGSVVISKIFHGGLMYDFTVMCILFMYCCKHVRLTCVQ